MLFVSHATTDDAKVDKFVADLRAAGLTEPLWVDHQKGIIPGAVWHDEIQNAVNICDGGIFLLTPTSAKSQFCMAEWTRILQRGKLLYVVLPESIPLTEIPLWLGVFQYSDLTKPEAVAALVQAAVKGTPLALTDPGISTAKRITGEIDPMLKIPMQGRDSDIAEALTKIKDTPLFIVGIGGLGKSRLAYALIEQPNWNGAVWHRVSDTSTAEDVFLLLRQHFNLDVTIDDHAVLDNVRASSRLLIVIDNAEYATETSRPDYIRVIDRLRDAGASVCITSRELWRDVKVKQPLEPSELSTADAGRLVLTFTRLMGTTADLVVRALEIGDAARRHPGLIEFAVGKLNYMPVTDVLSELHALESADAQAALTEMIGITVNQMTAKHRDLSLKTLRRLAVCRGGFTAAAGQAIAKRQPAAFFAQVRVLIDYRFVHFQNERYSIDDLVREAVSEDKSARHPHYDFYKAFAEQLEESPDHLKYVKMDVERDNLDAAFEWSIIGNPKSALWLANTCGRMLANRGRWVQRLDWFIRLNKVLESHPDKSLLASTQNSIGVAYEGYPFGEHSDNLRLAATAYQAALVYRTADSLPQDYARTLSNLGNVYSRLSEIENQKDNLRLAVAAYEEALIYRTENINPLDYAGTKNNLANAYSLLAMLEDKMENLRKAVAAYEIALVYYKPNVEPLDHALIQNNLGNTYRRLAELENREENLRGAMASYEAALIYLTPESAPLSYADTQHNAGIALDELGDLLGAIRCWREAEYYFRQMDHPEAADLMLEWIAEAESRLNAPPDNP